MKHWLPTAWKRLQRPSAAAVGNARWRVFAASCALLGLLAHLVLLPWFLWRGVPELVTYSLLTLPVYLFAAWVFVLRPGLPRGWHLAGTVGVGLELAGQGALATWLLGWGAGFHYYLLLVPLVVLFSPFGRPRQRALLSAAVGLGYLALWDASGRFAPVYALPPDELRGYLAANFALVFVVVMAIGFLFERAATRMEGELEWERQRSERLLLNTLPAAIAQRLKDRPDEAIAERHAEVSVLFCDIVGFTRLAERLPPEALVDLLNRVFTAFDDLADAHGVEKIKTIGDAYMVAAGLPVPRPDHAAVLADLALGMVAAVAALRAETGLGLDVRIGIHSGPVVAGVIGRRKFAYDLWGDVVNTAARMESHGVPGAVQVTEATARLLGARYPLAPRGELDVKGKGGMPVFLLQPPG
ncbi:MAG TPA: adenylate/guanylate cyclase domain-containing protein [Arenimonas sp.]|uniref:adenylate/guanylate cyclase domain-containing protein n=1 Tax=Arenimonas sp. TaxID=1872635 RepID=UPI002D7EEA6D|nr:adenylate/guanylate cyclase domain-containing protein [Arenimonas sp.]HEU0152203.1 adenylate/guanylate cyclase domain-containing protein [Arenimonas sp.]